MVNQKPGRQPVGAQQEVGRALHVSLEHSSNGGGGDWATLMDRVCVGLGWW